MGLALAAPVGPIGLLCIQRTLNEGRVAGFCSGLGATVADMIYGGLAGFGVTLVSNFLVRHQQGLHLIGSVVICYLGLKIFLSKPSNQAAASTGNGLFKAFLSTLFLMLSNPLTIAVFMTLFAGMGATSTNGNYSAVAALVCGIALGSALWWMLLCSGVNLLRHKLTIQRLQWINRIAGMVVVGFGVAALWSL